jgi:Asp-tRNA(Asn)/Glu-tRNA(Gln) amidotransferase B subunit
MRGKESAHDYRYFPEPDLLPLEIDGEWVERVRLALPELPDARAARFVAEYGLPEYDAEVLTARKDLADYFEPLAGIVADVVARHPEQVAQVRAGKDKVIGFLVGQVMQASGGKANPQLVQELLRTAIGA